MGDYMNEAKLYRILRPLIKLITIIFIRPKYIGIDNIPKDGRIILAGNHTSIIDPLILISSTKRSIHFLAKNELWHGPKKIIFSNMGLIPVNRKTKDHNALVLAEKYLNNEQIIGIFPEGTTEKGRGLLPFKIGAIKMAKDTNTKIIPFTIKGKYKLFSKDLTITFGKYINVTDNDLEKENENLRNIIKEMINNNGVDDNEQ